MSTWIRALSSRRDARMPRRTLLRGGLLTAFTLMGVRGTRMASSADTPAAIPVTPATYELNQGWLFGGAHAGGATTAGYDDSAFTTVTLPHNVTDLSWRLWNPASWENRWIYRRHLDGDGLTAGRVFVDFDGVMAAAEVYLNGRPVGDHLGGYLPWSVELTGLIEPDANVLAVVVDGRWLQVPPCGAHHGAAAVDYLQPSGIYRDVNLRVVPEVYLSDVFAKPVDVLTTSRRVDVECTLDAAAETDRPVVLSVRLLDGARVMARAETSAAIAGPGVSTLSVSLRDLGEVGLWGPDSPTLYTVEAELTSAAGTHTVTRRIGFREARFEVDGFVLNGRRTKLFGLNRHQIYPYAGMAMPARVQRRDAEILKQDFNCLMVRCSHYPQSPHFLDACDELGIMVWQEPPGWQYVGNGPWQELALRDVREMVIRDRSRPSVIIWGTRLNETASYRSLYRRTREAADELDGTRPTSGSMDVHSTAGWAQDVFAYDDYTGVHHVQAALRPPLPGVPYLISEAVGALDGSPHYRWTDPAPVLAVQAAMHAEVHQIAHADERYAGLLGWAAFDYASMNGRSFDHVKWPGVADGFRVPKPGAAFYQSQADPGTRVVIAPTFFWDFGPGSPRLGPGRGAMIATNCDRLEIYVDGRHVATGLPDRARFGSLPHPPVFVDLTVADTRTRPELRIDGYVRGAVAGTLRMSSDPAGDRLAVTADDDTLTADGSDATRLVFRAADAYGNHRPHVTGDVHLSVSGPAVLVGDNPFAFGEAGGVGGAWIRTLPGRTGEVTVTAAHPALGGGTARLTVVAPAAERRFA